MCQVKETFLGRYRIQKKQLFSYSYVCFNPLADYAHSLLILAAQIPCSYTVKFLIQSFSPVFLPVWVTCVSRWIQKENWTILTTNGSDLHTQTSLGGSTI
jgi:hypothetical protein